MSKNKSELVNYIQQEIDACISEEERLDKEYVALDILQRQWLAEWNKRKEKRRINCSRKN